MLLIGGSPFSVDTSDGKASVYHRDAHRAQITGSDRISVLGAKDYIRFSISVQMGRRAVLLASLFASRI